MNRLSIVLMAACLSIPGVAQDSTSGGPKNEKAQKTYKEALNYAHQQMLAYAIEAFKKADKQDGGHCQACQKRILEYSMQVRDWKTAESTAEQIVAEAQAPREVAMAHYQFGNLLMSEALDRHKREVFQHAHEEFEKALTLVPKFPAAVFSNGRALAYLEQDEEAKKRFQEFVEMRPEDGAERQRAILYIARPDLARALMAPAFAVNTLDGKRISLDDLQGKVVLIDFWATWCEPCREALPHVREIARKFNDQPFVVLSVSVDDDENKWKEFVAQNQMTWAQYFDKGFTGPLARSFGVHAIPHTFTIDADGILQDERIGDASIEGKLKKLIKRAQEKQTLKTKD